MTDPTQETMQIRATPTIDQFWSAVRGLLLASAGYAAGKGWLPADLGGDVVTIVMMLLPLMWAQITTIQAHDQTLKAARLPPQNVTVR